MGSNTSFPRRNENKPATKINSSGNSPIDSIVCIENASHMTLQNAAAVLKSCKKSCLTVLRKSTVDVSEDYCIDNSFIEVVEGILTEQDIVRMALVGGNTTTVLEAMTKNIVCLEIEDDSKTVEEYFEIALQIMAKRSFRHVPFIRKRDGHFLGMVDIVQAVSSGKCASILAHTLSFPAGKLMRVVASLSDEQDGNDSHAIGACLHEDRSSAYDAALLMKKMKRSSLLVLGKRNALVGILTESDIAHKVIGNDQSLTDTPVSTIMTKNPMVVSASINPFEGIKTMVRKKFRHLPVVSKKKVITVLDILTLVKVSCTAQQQHNSVTTNWSSMMKTISSDSSTYDSRLEPKGYVAKEPEVIGNGFEENDTLEDIDKLDECRNASNVVKRDDEGGEKTEPEAQKESLIDSSGPPAQVQNDAHSEATDIERSGIDCLLSSDFERAITLLSQAIDIRRKEESVDKTVHLARLYTRRGNVLSCTGQLDDAMRDFSEALDTLQEVELNALLNEDSLIHFKAEAIIGLCEILIETGRFEEAVKRASFLTNSTLQENLTQAKQFSQQLLCEALKFKDLGKEFFTSHDYAGAIVAYTSAIRAEKAWSKIAVPEIDANGTEIDYQNELLAILLSNRAVCYQYMHNFKYALQDARDSIVANPLYTKAWLRICDCLFELKRYAECVDSCKKALSAITNDESVLELRAKLNVLLEKSKARLATDKASKLTTIKSIAETLRSANIAPDENSMLN